MKPGMKMSLAGEYIYVAKINTWRYLQFGIFGFNIMYSFSFKITYPLVYALCNLFHVNFRKLNFAFV